MVVAVLWYGFEIVVFTTENVATLFRANSLGTKAADQFMKVGIIQV
jgi:hypothetical protein